MSRVALAAALLLGGCGPSLADMPPAPTGRCVAEPARGLLGQPYSAALARRVMKQSGARPQRAIRPGQAVTMDYRTDRVDVHVDRDNRITAITCG